MRKINYFRNGVLIMNKNELVSAVKNANPADFQSTAAAKRAVDAVLESIANALQSRDSVTLVGFGTFSVQHRNPRQGRNVQTQETIEIPARDVVKFKPGSGLKLN